MAKADNPQGPGSTRFNFTVDALMDLKPAARPYAVFDTKQAGLSLFVSPKGKMVFYHRRKNRGVSKRRWIGEFYSGKGERVGVSIAWARSQAAAFAGDYAKGEDPADVRQQQRAELTVSELFDRFLKEQLLPHRRPASVKAAEQLWRDYIEPDLGDCKLGTVTRSKVAELHTRIGMKHAVRANRALEVVRSMFTKAIDWNLAPATWHGVNPASRFPRFKEKSRERYLTGDEMGRFFAALDSVGRLRDFFLVALLTGARRGNVQAMRWNHLDLSSGVWHIPGAEAKEGDPLHLVLTGEVTDILSRRQRERDELLARVKARTLHPVPKLTFREARTWRNEARKAETAAVFVFPGWGKSGHLVEPKNAWKAVLEAARIKGLTVHDLRRSCGSWLAAGNASQATIQKALGHASSASSAVYARLQLDPVRQALEAAQQAMRQVAGRAADDKAKVQDLASARQKRQAQK